MAIKQEVAIGIAQGLSQFWKCEEFRDFTVKVDTVEFGCHQLILAACSDFFKGLFRSRMQEMEQKCATIYGISSDIFELLLESMYTGIDVLTNDNVIDIWRAAHQLQIHFMVTECEHFAIKTLSLETYILYLQTCKALNSTIAIDKVWDFVHTNCNHFFETTYFLEISVSEMENLVKSQHLGTKTEDEVIHAILKWSKHFFLKESHHNTMEGTNEDSKAIWEKENVMQELDLGVGVIKKRKVSGPNDDNGMGTTDNEFNTIVQTDAKDENRYCDDMNTKDLRCKCLTVLLSITRTYIVSKECLKLLSTHDLVKDNIDAQKIIMDALFYQLQLNKRNGYWPLKASHRSNSKHKQCIVNAKSKEKEVMFSFYNFAKKQWFELSRFYNFEELKLAATDNKLYAVGIKTTNETYQRKSKNKMLIYIYLFRKDRWSEINTSIILCSQTFDVVMVGSLMFIFSHEESKLLRLDTNTNVLTEMLRLPDNFPVYVHVMSYQQSILVFYYSQYVLSNETTIQCYDTSLNTWKQLDNLEGLTNGMTSFIDENFTYLLQLNGNLWKVVMTESNVIHFEIVVKLWSCEWPLYGAVTFMNELYIHGENSDVLHCDSTLKRTLPGVFIKINYLTSMCKLKGMSIPCVLETNN